uniref:DUF4968 domain-containing protein n=1 Tax=Angiostrongylus cantonensis TaxID=6313 RepID=A0A0K0CYM7_ANGCA
MSKLTAVTNCSSRWYGLFRTTDNAIPLAQKVRVFDLENKSNFSCCSVGSNATAILTDHNIGRLGYKGRSSLNHPAQQSLHCPSAIMQWEANMSQDISVKHITDYVEDDLYYLQLTLTVVPSAVEARYVQPST